MSRGRKTKEEQLEILKNERVKKIEEAQKIKEEIQTIDNKIEELQNQILLKEAEESKLILSDINVSLVEIAKAIKEKNFEYLEGLYKSQNDNKESDVNNNILEGDINER